MSVKVILKTVIPAPIHSLGATGYQKVLNFPYYIQEQSQWCWAACAQMTGQYFGMAQKDQCQLACRLHNQIDCCSNPSSTSCDLPCNINNISGVFTHIGLKSHFVNGSLSFSDLCLEIDKGRPVEVGFAWTRGGHAVMISGCEVDGGEEKVYLNDPSIRGFGIILYSELITAEGKGRWCWTWNNIS